MVVPAHNVVRPGLQCGGNKFVVVRVPAYALDLDRAADQSGEPPEACDVLPGQVPVNVLIVAAYFVPLEYSGELFQNGRGDDRFKLQGGPITAPLTAFTMRHSIQQEHC